MKKLYIALVICVPVFLYCLARGLVLSMTHDESSTFINFVSRPFWLIVTNDPPSANNHLLNTLLIKLSTIISDTSFFVRLPNLVASAFCLFFTYKFVTQFYKKWHGILLGLSILVLNQYQLEFFSLARGYGLSLSFMMGSLYFIQRFLQRERERERERERNTHIGIQLIDGDTCCLQQSHNA